MSSMLPSLDDITSDSRYLGSLLTLGAVAYMSPARYYLVRILAAQLNQIPADIDTLQIKGVYLELDTTAIPDPTAAKTVNVLLMDVPDLNVTTISNVNTCINKVVIPTWATTASRTPSSTGAARALHRHHGATKKNNAFIVKNFGLWPLRNRFSQAPLKCA
eukprot:tig00000388_g24770.t1